MANKFFEVVKHKWLRLPYDLNVRHQNIKHKTYPTFMFIHGLGATAEMWEEIITNLPAKSNYIAADMLGFGSSPNPDWEDYDVGLQARMLNYVFKKSKATGPLILVGHSLGSLVAIEYANKYHKKISQLILCSPPIYKKYGTESKLEYQNLLIKLFTEVSQDKEKLMKLYRFGKFTKIDPTVSVDESNINALVGSLSKSIINQKSINDIKNIKKPIDIVYGIVDPVVIGANISQLAKEMPNIKVTKVAASHTINKAYMLKIVSIINGDDTEKTT